MLPATHEGDVVGRRRGRVGQGDAELGEAGVDLRGHWGLPGLSRLPARLEAFAAASEGVDRTRLPG